ncbi:MAG TPA: amidohydrolase family protein [Candidatus Limnocylindrales bacterium]|nr:amidohydrolase family protein [Candidatus Limnocylindrales bacterium]
MKLKRSKLLLQFFAVAFGALALAVPSAAPQAGAEATEQGKFVLRKFEQAIGEETYTVTRNGDRFDAKINFKFTDRGRAVPLEATLQTATDLTPQNFEIKGNTSRLTTIDDEVDVQGDRVRLRNREKWSDAAKPKVFFTISGYAPATMQMLMVRYWAEHGSPAELETLPSGRVKIEPRGQDTIHVGDKDETLERYTVEGLIWGRETLWFDAKRNLVAAVTTDAEFDHFEAIREGYESALGKFVGIAGADGMAALSEMAKKLPGNREETLAIVGGTLVDGTGAPALPDSAVVISKGRVIAVGPRAKVKIPGGAKKVDARGKTILPGLWDMHAHFEQVEWGPIYLAAGATTVRDCGNEFEFIKAVRDAIAGGNGLGPRLLLAGVVDGTGPLALGIERVDTPEEAKTWTDRYHDAGFQQIKIYSSVKLEELKDVADEAHRLGMTVTGHVPEGIDAYQAIAAGQDMINHVQYVADIMRPPLPADAKRIDQLKADAEVDTNSDEAQKAIAFLVNHGTVVDPTLAIYEFETANTEKPTASFEPGVTKVAPELAQPLIDVEPPSQQSRLFQKSFQKNVQIVGALHRAGVPIVAGTDQTVPGYSLYREIELYVRAGFTPMEAIQAATIVPARVMGLDKELGTIEIGKQADLIILGANPLESIHNIRTVESVITGGTMYHCAELWQSVGFKP